MLKRKYCLSSCETNRFIIGISFKKLDPLIKALFYNIGYFIANHPSTFIIVPLILTCVLSTAIRHIEIENDFEYLFSPVNGRAHGERALVDELFSTSYSSPGRELKPLRAGQISITARDNGSLLRLELWSEIYDIDALVSNITATYDGEEFQFKDICSKAKGECMVNNVVNILGILPEFLNGTLRLTFPYMLDPKTFESYTFPGILGGIEVDNEGSMTSALALNLGYYVRNDEERFNNMSRVWEQVFIARLRQLEPRLLNVAFFSSQSVENDIMETSISVIPHFAIASAIIVSFCIVTLTRGDCVRSKTWLGVFAIIIVGMSCATAWGTLLLLGVPFIGLNMVAPFLMLGIGIDDAFVLLGAWNRTPLQDTVPRRLAATYADAAVSITITSITDTASFFIGALAPIPSVRIFCIYTGTCCLVTYLWMVAVFGAVMAISGWLEAGQRHAVCCFVVRPTSQAQGEACYAAMCAGGINPADPYNPYDNREHSVSIFFRDYVATALNNAYVKGLVILLFVAYLCVAGYGVTTLQEGLERRHLVRYNSDSVPFFNMQERFFSDFPFRVQIVFHGDYNYSDPATHDQMLEFVEQVEGLDKIADEIYTESWQRKFRDFTEYSGRYIGLNNSDEATYIRNLKDYSLTGDSVMDVVFNDDDSRILASRCFVQAYKVYGTEDSRDLMTDLRQLSDDSPLNVTTYNSYFMFMDQYGLIRSISIQTIGMATVVMFVVSMIFIPNPMCALWVGFAIASIETGVIGFMALWGVSLDSISMIQLIMCIGFSVDFSAHISYAYMSAEVDTPEERMRECLYSLGFPIVQAALSTLISIMVLTTVPSYIFITFFKTVFLVIFLGAAHGLIVLPVLLSLMDVGVCSRGKRAPKTSKVVKEMPNTLEIQAPQGKLFGPQKFVFPL